MKQAMTPTLGDARASAQRRADDIDRELTDLAEQRAAASADVLLNRDGAAAKLSAVAERIGALTAERTNLGLAVEEIGRREADQKRRGEAAEHRRLSDEQAKLLGDRSALYDEAAAVIEKLAAVASRCILLDADLVRLAAALGETPEPVHRQSKPRIHSYLEWRLAEIGFTPEFSWPHPSRRVRPNDY